MKALHGCVLLFGLIAASIAANAAAPFETQPGDDFLARLKFIKEHRPPLRFPRRSGIRRGISEGETYAVEDYGTPPGRMVSNSSPEGFNDTGQAFGSGSTAEGTACIAYNGSTFIDVSSSASIVNCSAKSIDDASEGKFTIVGSLEGLSDPGGVAFAASLSTTKTSISLKSFESIAPASTLFAINSFGVGFGTSYNAYSSRHQSYFVPFLYGWKGKGSFAALQRPCDTFAYYDSTSCFAPTTELIYVVGTYYDFENVCPFAGCQINNEDDVLVQAASGNTVSSYDIQTASVVLNVPESYTDAGNVIHYLGEPEITTYGVIVQDRSYPSNGLLYQIDVITGSTSSQTITTIPVNGDAECFPSYINMNDYGEILLYDYCEKGPSQYFTWDPINGAQVLNLPTSSGSYLSALPIAVNDNGQILVAITTTSSNTDWGVLNPVAADQSAARRAQDHTRTARPVR